MQSLLKISKQKRRNNSTDIGSREINDSTNRSINLDINVFIMDTNKDKRNAHEL